MNEDPAAGFPQVDRAGQPDALIRSLDARNAFDPTLKDRALTLLDVQAGQRILDIGCGAGDDVRALARLVSPTGWVVGLDSSETMLREAHRRVGASDLPVEFRLGDALDLDFADDTFDRCRADRVLQHLSDPQRAVSEMVRVARSGARIVVVDPDWDTLVIEPGERDATRRIVQARCDSFRNGQMGRRSRSLFKQAGLTDITVFADVLVVTDHAFAVQCLDLEQIATNAQARGAISAVTAEDWLRGLEEAGQADCFLYSLTRFIVAGRKP